MMQFIYSYSYMLGKKADLIRFYKDIMYMN